LSQIELTHTFHAPRELVFKAFTDSEHLQHWWGPAGWAFHVSTSDIRSGGVLHYSQKPDDGDVMWVKFEYSEIITPERIVYTSYFSDEDGNVIRAPFDDTWPLRVEHTYRFLEQEGKTVLTMAGAPVSATEDEMKTFRDSQAMFQEGFSGTFAQLDSYLSAGSI